MMVVSGGKTEHVCVPAQQLIIVRLIYGREVDDASSALHGTGATSLQFETENAIKSGY